MTKAATFCPGAASLSFEGGFWRSWGFSWDACAREAKLAIMGGLDAMIDIVGKGAASSWSKDMGIALQEARRMNLALPGLALVNQFYLSAQALGLENLGTQGLYKVLAAMNAIQT